MHDTERIPRPGAEDKSADGFRAWIESLAAAEATIPARIILERLPDGGDQPADRVAEPSPDRLLTVTQAAERLGVDRRWLYRRADKLPFTKRLGPGTLRFSEKGLAKWMERR